MANQCTDVWIYMADRCRDIRRVIAENARQACPDFDLMLEDCAKCSNAKAAIRALDSLETLYRGEAVSAKTATEMMDEANNQSFPP